jgi:3-methylfumaryl-CoA hydratase
MILFTPTARQSELGRDGHPRLGDFLPPVDLPRRMLGGRRTQFLAPIAIGTDVRRMSEIVQIAPKQGRSGRLVLVTIQHRIFTSDVCAVIEDQDVLYREAASAGAAPETAAPVLPPPDITEDFLPDERLLFRYSAVTFNGHRIHYDHPYATSVEGYPALVVNGGLTALFLLELFRRQADREPRLMTARNVRALYCGHPAKLHAQRDGAAWRLWATDDLGRLALEATAA